MELPSSGGEDNGPSGPRAAPDGRHEIRLVVPCLWGQNSPRSTKEDPQSQRLGPRASKLRAMFRSDPCPAPHSSDSQKRGAGVWEGTTLHLRRRKAQQMTDALSKNVGFWTPASARRMTAESIDAHMCSNVPKYEAQQRPLSPIGRASGHVVQGMPSDHCRRGHAYACLPQLGRMFAKLARNCLEVPGPGRENAVELENARVSAPGANPQASHFRRSRQVVPEQFQERSLPLFRASRTRTGRAYDPTRLAVRIRAAAATTRHNAQPMFLAEFRQKQGMRQNTCGRHALAAFARQAVIMRGPRGGVNIGIRGRRA